MFGLCKVRYKNVQTLRSSLGVLFFLSMRLSVPRLGLRFTLSAAKCSYLRTLGQAQAWPDVAATLKRKMSLFATF